jgi:hypothetical protein
MLLEIAAVVAIVSLLPRFDLRPKTAAGETAPPVDIVLPPRVTQPSYEKIFIPKAPLSDGFRRREDESPASVAQARFASHEVEQRLDRASQGLVNTLGTAAADLANGVLHSASRPTVPSIVPPPQWTPAPSITPLPPPPAMAPASQPLAAPMHRRWMNY